MMRSNIYEHRFRTTCPNDGKRIIYSLRIETDQVEMAEAIEEACRFGKAAFHEAIADELFDKFGGSQVLTATHGKVDITTVRNAA